MEFFKYKNKIEPAKGRLLISEPYLPDPNFERTTVLLTEHNDAGSVGFILNKPSDSLVGEIMEDLKLFHSRIFIGGPVEQDTLHYIHQLPDLEDAIKLQEGLYWGGNFEQLLSLIETQQVRATDIKFFLGYSGWSPGQLADELKVDSWIVSNLLTAKLVFETEPDQMWKHAMRGLGGRFSVYANYPADPRLN
ncbi:MAG: YqgE/AlgH family protein [Cyclobacteriaceae bacterium]|nr:YqgE/AlgH family protein [Cyclobacteriaceae bacterium]